MAIEPIGSGQTPGVSPEQLGETTARSRAAQEKKLAPEAGKQEPDQVELSAAAKDLVAMHGLEDAPVSQLPAGQLKQVMERISSGFYDQAEVRDEVLLRLQSDVDET